MAPWVRTVTGGGREEQMQEQDRVLSASATMWAQDCPTAVAWLRTEASSLTHYHAASDPCSISRRQLPAVMQRQMGRCA